MEFTYEKNDNTQTIYETYEWDSSWIELANDNKKKRIFHIGDSISCGIRGCMNSMPECDYYVDGFGTSKGIDNPYLKDSLDLFASQLPYIDNVLFNNGLHGWHLSEEDYEKHFDNVVKFLTERFAGKRIYIVLTTAIKGEERMVRIRKRNESAVRIAEKYSLPVIDLFTVSEANQDLLIEDGVHGTEAFYKKLSAVISDSLNK